MSSVCAAGARWETRNVFPGATLEACAFVCIQDVCTISRADQRLPVATSQAVAARKNDSELIGISIMNFRARSSLRVRAVVKSVASCS